MGRWMARLERAVGAAISIMGVAIAIFTTFCVAYYFMPSMLEGSDYTTIEAVLASWMPQIIITAMLMILSVGLVRLGSTLMRHAAPEETRAAEVGEVRTEQGPPPFIPPRPAEQPRPPPRAPEREERLVHRAFEAARHEAPSLTAPKPPGPPEEEKVAPRPGPPAEGARPPGVRPALDEDELSRIIRILRERRKRT